MKRRGFSRREFLQVGAGAAAGLMTASFIGCSGGGGGGGPEESGPTIYGTLKEGLYRGHRSITAAFQPTDSPLYRQLLPNDFQMPDSLQVIVSVLSYHNVTTPLVPYHEGYVLLSCKYQGQSGFYVLTMPVDDRTACDGGRAIGFPKYVADSIELAESSGVWSGQVTHSGVAVMHMTFTPQAPTVSYNRVNPGPSFLNLVPPGQGPKVYSAYFTGQQMVNSRTGTATVTAGPNESWGMLLQGASLVNAQFEDTTGNYTIQWGTGVRAGVVSIARISNGRIDLAVEEAIAMLGGIGAVTVGKQKIMLKPNLVTESTRSTTKPEVIRALAQLMINAGKEVLIGEGSACAMGYNLINGVVYRTKKQAILDGMQQYVFDTLGYSALANSLGIPLINLHSGEMATVSIPGGFVYDNISIHRSLTEIDMLCSVPMMKTHTLGGVTLGMKNLIGTYPGTIYGSVRHEVHDQAAHVEGSAVAGAVVDMVRANKLGLVVIDASTAMEGNGPDAGDLVNMNLIIAGTNPLATDMVAANVMGFSPTEIPTFQWANRAGMQPQWLSMIEIRGESIENVRRHFTRPQITPWSSVSNIFGGQEL
jgi:uncharacterized protein (DUF362 family)